MTDASIGPSAGRPRRWRTRARLPATVLVLATLIAAALLAGTVAVRSATHGVRLLQFNMCGHVCRTPTQDKVDSVVDSLVDFHPAVASLNEVCRSQFTGIVRGTADRGWAMHARFIITQPDECTGDDDYGIALLTRSPITATDRLNYAAQDAGNPEHRGLLCVQAKLGRRPTHICTTHIVDSTDDPVGQVRRTQILTAARRASAYRGPVVLMGDFNAKPTAPSMSAIYTKAHGGGAHGVFDEVGQGPGLCRCGAATHASGTKYDYIFVTARDFDVVDGQVTRSAYSDHRALLGWVTER